MTPLLKFLSFLICVCLVSCSGLQKTILKENPDFAKNAEKFLVTSPLSHDISKPLYSYEFEDDQKIRHNVVARWQPGEKEFDRIDETYSEESVEIETEEFWPHNIFIFNPIDSCDYELVGKLQKHRSIEKSEDESFSTVQVRYPVKFWLFEEGKDIGEITVHSPDVPTTKINIELHGKLINVEFQDAFNNKCYAFYYENELIAMVAFEMKWSIQTKAEGEVLLKPGLSGFPDSDIFTLYAATDMMMKVIQWGEGFFGPKL